MTAANLSSVGGNFAEFLSYKYHRKLLNNKTHDMIMWSDVLLTFKILPMTDMADPCFFFLVKTPSSLFQVQENSPGHRAGLEPFFDFIVSINDTRLVRNSCSFNSFRDKFLNKAITFSV